MAPPPLLLHLKHLLFAALVLHKTISATEGADERCELSSIEVEQRNTGMKVGYDPVFEVEVKNLCRCTVASVYLRSEGFASSMIVDPKVFRRQGIGYLLNDGRAIRTSLSVKFRYSWDRAFAISPDSFLLSCQ